MKGRGGKKGNGGTRRLTGDGRADLELVDRLTAGRTGAGEYTEQTGSRTRRGKKECNGGWPRGRTDGRGKKVRGEGWTEEQTEKGKD
jgi:hypothetical protein